MVVIIYLFNPGTCNRSWKTVSALPKDMSRKRQSLEFKSKLQDRWAVYSALYLPKPELRKEASSPLVQYNVFSSYILKLLENPALTLPSFVCFWQIKFLYNSFVLINISFSLEVRRNFYLYSLIVLVGYVLVLIILN